MRHLAILAAAAVLLAGRSADVGAAASPSPLCPSVISGARMSALQSYRFYQGEAGGPAKMMADMRRENGHDVALFPTSYGGPFNVRCDYADGGYLDVGVPTSARECLASRSAAGVFNLTCR